MAARCVLSRAPPFVRSHPQHQTLDSVDAPCPPAWQSCFVAYGQTGSGKSHAFGTDDAKTGLIQRAMKRLVSIITDAKQTGAADVSLFVSFLEVDGDALIDLGGIHHDIPTQ